VSRDSEDLLWDASLTYDVTTQPTLTLPTITPAGGVFSAPVQVLITTVPADAEVRFTLDGTEPDQSSTRYSGPFVVETSTQVRARAYKPGYNESGIAGAAFVVETPGVLEILPPDGLSTSGTVGGPFSPSFLTYTLTNSGGSGLAWTASKGQSWLSLSGTSGSLAAGATTNVTVAVNTDADSLAAGRYGDTVFFTDTSNPTRPHVRHVELGVVLVTMSLVKIDSTGQFQITLAGQPYQAYVIEASSNLAQWSAIETNTAGSDGRLLLLDGQPPQTRQRFYRGRSH
jgi:hypothetical protein